MSYKKELEQLEFEHNTPPLLDQLYVVVSNRKHDSGYKMYKIYGIAYEGAEITYKKCLSTCSDVINLECAKDFTWVRIDSIETNLFRFFLTGSKKFRITGRLSDFNVEVVRVAKDE